MKAVYKLGITVQELVNAVAPGYQNNISYKYKSTRVKALWSSDLRRVLNCHNVTGAHLGTRNRT